MIVDYKISTPYNDAVNRTATTAVVRSYAKINFALRVLGKRPDGYHTIHSVMQTISLHDTLTIRLVEPPGIRVTCSVADVPCGEANLAHRAADILLKGKSRLGIEIEIEKHIPREAGLGGGSSNGAVVLATLNRLLRLHLSQDELIAKARYIGADVPFFMVGGTAIVEGTGERVTGLPDAGKWWIVVAKPAYGVPTNWAYKQFDEMCANYPDMEGRSDCYPNPVELSSDILGMLWNDLEAPVFESYPEIRHLKEALLDSGARGALMCGSGSAVFGLFENEKEASSAEQSIQNLADTYVACTVSRSEYQRALTSNYNE